MTWLEFAFLFVSAVWIIATVALAISLTFELALWVWHRATVKREPQE